MKSARSSESIFIAKYESGRMETFSINEEALRSGDHGAEIVALEMQSKGRLPPGKIVFVRRA